ncbi:hypothetical protein STENM223S_05784 [Streptomyces tendae]
MPDFTATVAAAMVSPSTMIVSSPYRSAMWCGCQDDGCPPSANAGTHSSSTTITRNSQPRPPSGTTSSPSQPSWQISTPAEYLRAMVLSGGAADRAALSHCAAMAIRMIT